ncbi:MAG: ATP-binding protein, partial [Anaerolineales bacterium]
AAALTEWARDELMARSLSEVVAAPGPGEALEEFYLIEPGSVRHFYNVPLRTRSGRLACADLRLSALADPERGETLVLVLATPVEERLAQEKESNQQLRVLEGADYLLALLASPSETALSVAVDITQKMFAADAAGLYHVTAHPPGMRLQSAEGIPPNFPRVLGPSEAQYLKTPLFWASSPRAEGLLHQAARAAGWASLLAYPVGEPPAIVGALFVAYRPGNPPAPQTAPLLAIVARQIHHLFAQIARAAELENAQRLAVRLSNHLATLHAQMEEGMVLINGAGLIDEINLAAARMLGYRSEDVTGLPFDDVLISDGPLTSAVRQALLDNGPDSLEDKLRRRNGEAFPVLVRLRTLPPPEGGCALMLRDVSEAHASEVHREHLDQLAYVGQATQSFAHEVRSPLNNIAMGVQYLAARLPPNEEAQQALSKIQAECSRLSSLMNDMLSWAKPVDPKLEPTDLAVLLKKLLNRWSAKVAQRNVRLVFQAAEACPPVLADPRLIEQVFVNLIDNALQAMPAGGHLSVTLQPAQRGAQARQRFVEARVVDSGPGISEEARRQIFDPYFTTKPNGTGLGLAICKRLVTIHRGAIGVESFPGTGTIITVTLPVYEEVASDAKHDDLAAKQA